jgi:hypothetical protein
MAYFNRAMKLLDTLPETDLNRKRRISLLVNQEVVFLLLFKLPEYYDLLIHYEPLAVGLDKIRGCWGRSMPAWDTLSGRWATLIRPSRP